MLFVSARESSLLSFRVLRIGSYLLNSRQLGRQFQIYVIGEIINEMLKQLLRGLLGCMRDVGERPRGHHE